MPAKKAKQAKPAKPAKPLPEGITSKKTDTGINVLLSENGRKVALLRGYNNQANVQKGLASLKRILDQNYDPGTGKFNVTVEKPKKPSPLKGTKVALTGNPPGLLLS